jgi:putative ABC transport system permease protein
MMGETPRDLTIGDAMALQRSSYVRRLAPLVVGSAPVSWQQREREVTILGTTSDMYQVRHLNMYRGQFLPELEMSRGSSECVLGYKLYRELFGPASALGQWVRVNQNRCRVVGILEEEGMSIGVDMGDVLIMPVASAESLFNVSSLFRILIEASSRDVLEKAQRQIRDIIRERHDGEDDITILSQDSLLGTFNRILSTLTYTLGGIAAVSLVVAGIMIMNVMLVAVSQRTPEIGLLKALGAPRRQIMVLFLTESAFLSLIGALLGLVVGLGGNWVLQGYFPDFPFVAPDWALWSAMAVALLTGVMFGLMPARRAADLNPVEALAGR